MTSVKVSSTFLTTVTDVPLLTKESAIHPPIFAVTAIVSHGKTAKSPDSVRLNFNTCSRNAKNTSNLTVEVTKIMTTTR